MRRSTVDGAASPVNATRARGLELSGKSGLLRVMPVQHTHRALNATGVCVKVATKARDLGLDFSSRRRSAQVAWAAQVRGLVEANREGIELCLAGVKPKASGGIVAQGASPTALKLLRSKMAGMAGNVEKVDAPR